MIPGRGVAAKVEGYHVLAGNRAMLNENNITFPTNVAAQSTDHHTENGVDDSCSETDRQADTSSVSESCKYITAEFVGSENMLCRKACVLIG